MPNGVADVTMTRSFFGKNVEWPKEQIFESNGRGGWWDGWLTVALQREQLIYFGTFENESHAEKKEDEQ